MGPDAAHRSRRDRDRSAPGACRGRGRNRERDDGEHLPARGAAGGRHALGQELVRSQRVIAALLLASAACKPAPTKPAPRPAAPQVRATVLTIESTMQPSNRKIVHSLVIANDRARSGDELDAW